MHEAWRGRGWRRGDIKLMGGEQKPRMGVLAAYTVGLKKLAVRRAGTAVAVLF